MDINLTTALEALQKSFQTSSGQVVELRGERGEPGRDGRDGKDGKDAAPVSISIGIITSGDKPEARVRTESNNSFVLDLCLPRGPEGPRGLHGLPSEIPGPKGEKGDTPTPEEIKTLVKSVINENREAFRGPKGDRGESGAPSTVPGPAGQSIQGPQGERGEAGHSVNEEELKAIFIRVLSETGVLTETQARLVAVRTELKKAINRASARNQGEIRELYRRIDNIIDVGVTD